MTKRTLRIAAVIAPILAACGGAEIESMSSAARSGGTLHQFCALQEIPVWAGAGNPSSAIFAGTLVLADGTATLTLAGERVLGPSELHLQFADELAAIPVTSTGNPVPGQFACAFAITPDRDQSVYTFDLSNCPVNDANGDGKVFAAAHFAFPELGGLEAVSFTLPDAPVTLTVAAGYGPETWFPQVTISNDGWLNGAYGGWCGEFHRAIRRDYAYSAMLYSTYDPVAMASVADLMSPMTEFQAGNVALANYVVNRFRNGDTVSPLTVDCAPTGGFAGQISFSHIQRALWTLLEGHDSFSSTPDSFVNAITCDARANGVGFVPGCNQYVLIAAVPFDATGAYAAQMVLVPVPVPCGGGAAETAWADGRDGALFPGARQWGAYFEYDLACEP